MLSLKWKKVVTLLLVMSMIIAMTGCGSDGETEDKVFKILEEVRLEVEQKSQADKLTSLYHLIEKSTNVNELQELLEQVAKTIVGRINQYNMKNINVILQKCNRIH